jgi:hypothetical protein
MEQRGKPLLIFYSKNRKYKQKTKKKNRKNKEYMYQGMDSSHSLIVSESLSFASMDNHGKFRFKQDNASLNL